MFLDDLGMGYDKWGPGGLMDQSSWHSALSDQEVATHTASRLEGKKGLYGGTLIVHG